MTASDHNDSQCVTDVARPPRSKVAKKAFLAFVLLTFIYIAGAISFRAYRMNPKNEYYGFYLPSATPTMSTTEEETNRITHAMTREPTLLEKIFLPAEFVFRSLQL